MATMFVTVSQERVVNSVSVEIELDVPEGSATQEAYSFETYFESPAACRL